MQTTPKTIIRIFLLIFCINFISAQKKQFDVVDFTLPKDWKQNVKEDVSQIYTEDNKTGEYVLALITKSSSTDFPASQNFEEMWKKLVAGNVAVEGSPTMQKPETEKGWKIISGQSYYIENNKKGFVTLINATGNRKTTSVLVMTNTSKYQDQILEFINSLDLNENAMKQNQENVSISNNVNSPIIGLWTDYDLETSGYSNGVPNYSSGYFRSEYSFSKDGKYVFRAKNWSTKTKEILFVYESGTYSINGDLITLTPQKGKGEWWSKIGNDTSKWGKFVKSSGYTLEKSTYKFDFKKFIGVDENTLVLKPNQPTPRENLGNNSNNSSQQEYFYKQRISQASLIDNPPGFKTNF